MSTARSPRRMPAGPLLRQIELAGGPAALGVVQNSREEQAILRAKREGTLTERAADRLATRLLGLTLWELVA